jgi:hypothetical protein
MTATAAPLVLAAVPSLHERGRGRAPLQVRRAARGGWRDGRHQIAVLAAGVTAVLQARGVSSQSSLK